MAGIAEPPLSPTISEGTTPSRTQAEGVRVALSPSAEMTRTQGKLAQSLELQRGLPTVWGEVNRTSPTPAVEITKTLGEGAL